MDMQELVNSLEHLNTRVKETWRLLKLDETKKEVEKLDKEMTEPDFWNDSDKAKSVSQKAKELKEELKLCCILTMILQNF